MKYGASREENFAAVTFREKNKAYVASEPFNLRVDNRALSWLKTFSMHHNYIGRRIERLVSYNKIVGRRIRDAHQRADSFSKKT